MSEIDNNSKNKQKYLDIIERYQKEIILLSRTSSLLDWDQQTYMPKKSAKSRAEQKSFLSKLIHEKITSEELFQAILNVKKEGLSEREKAMMRKIDKEVKRAKQLPKEFVEELSRASSLGFSAWQEAKQKSDFGIFKDYLKKIVELKRKETKYIGLPGHPYNSLLEEYEEEMTAEKLKSIFEDLKNELIGLLKKIEATDTYKNQKKEKYNFNEKSQLELSKELIKVMGFSEDVFRIDLSEHPFSIGFSPGDVRITTNIKKGVTDNFSSTIHEAGHALYNLNMPEEEEFNFLYDSPSYGMHESQSRFWENMIGKGKAFQQYFFPKIQERFDIEDFDKWYHNLNLIEPGKIRIESDEIHYCLHIILRFELELGLIEGSIEVEDLPKLWNKKMKEYFNVEIKNDSEGVLQDVHWSSGNFGYFPTYAIGTIYSSQLYKQLKKEIPNIEGDIFEGNFERISAWLKEKIHKHGARYVAEDLIKSVCEEGMNPRVFIEYLNKKYQKIYNFT